MTVLLQRARYPLVLLLGFIAGSHAVDAVQTWKTPSAWQNLAIVLVSLALSGLVWWLLRPTSSLGK